MKQLAEGLEIVKSSISQETQKWALMTMQTVTSNPPGEEVNLHSLPIVTQAPRLTKKCQEKSAPKKIAHIWTAVPGPNKLPDNLVGPSPINPFTHNPI